MSRKLKSYKFEENTIRLLDLLSKKNGRSATNMLEQLVLEAAKANKIK